MMKKRRNHWLPYASLFTHGEELGISPSEVVKHLRYVSEVYPYEHEVRVLAITHELLERKAREQQQQALHRMPAAGTA